MIIHTIDSLEHAGLDAYRTMRRPEDHVIQGIFVAEGEKVVRRLLESSLAVRSLLLTDEWFARLRPEIAPRDEPEVEIFLAPADLLETIVGFRFHQGVMAVGVVPPEPSLDALGQPHLLVALDRIHHAENVGVMIRNGVALGADGMVIGETSCGAYVRRAVRNSMGALFRTPVYHTTGLADALRGLRNRFGTAILCADPHGATHIWEAPLSGNVCLVMGNEESGVSPAVREAADALVAIPMAPGVDSLNVGSAAAVFLYEACRQRKARITSRES